MSMPEVKKKRGRPKGSKNNPKKKQKQEVKPTRRPIVKPVRKPIDPPIEKTLEEEPQEEVEQNGNEVIVVEDSVTGEKKTTQWVNEATKAKKSLSMSLRGLKKLREIINLSIIMAEQATDLQGFMDALNGSINGTAGLITCDDKNGWMDLSFCRHKCPERCYKYNTGRWICSLLRCSNEKITLCDEKNGHCQSFDIIMGFADRYTTETFRIEKELESNGNNN